MSTRWPPEPREYPVALFIHAFTITTNTADAAPLPATMIPPPRPPPFCGHHHQRHRNPDLGEDDMEAEGDRHLQTRGEQIVHTINGSSEDQYSIPGTR